MTQQNAAQISFESLQRIIRAIDVHSRSLLRDYQLTSPQLGVLKELARHGEVPIGSLAKSRFLGAPTITGVVDRLEKNGWAVRTHSEHDRRQVLIKITPEGKKLLAKNPPLLIEEFCDRLLKLPKSTRSDISSSLQQVADLMEDSILCAQELSVKKQRKP